MRKLRLSILGSFLALAALSPAQDVEISMDHPAQVRAGEEFVLTIDILKGSLTDYSRFSQDLPQGLTASNISSPNADFSFDKQRVRVIWLKLPEEEGIKVSYRIKVDQRLKGEFRLGGVFAYVVNDERKFLNLEDQPVITIIPSSTVDPELIVDINDFGAATAAVVAAAEKDAGNFAMAIRQSPELQSNGSYLVHLLVKNTGQSKYIKIEESLPAGYIFEELESNKAIVSPTNNMARYIWMKLPSTPEYVISYRLSPKQGESQDEVKISGKIFYTSGTDNLIEEVKQMDVDLASLSASQKGELLATGTFAAHAEEGAKAEPDRMPEPVVEKEPEPEVRTAAPAGKSEKIKDTYVLQGLSGVSFRVQLIAKNISFDATSYFRSAGVREELRVEHHEGLYKYTAGSFDSYAQAVSYLKQVEQIEEVEGTFVVAYLDGKRVPVSSVR